MARGIHLGVNIDHVATLRQARGLRTPSPVYAALIAQEAGASNITMHLREDRRHIQDQDVVLVKEAIHIPMNMEMAINEEMVGFVSHVMPQKCCFVPEKREEITTEGGLDIVNHENHVTEACVKLATQGVTTCAFIEPYSTQIDAAVRCGLHAVEFHTGAFANAETNQEQQQQLSLVIEAVDYAYKKGLTVHAGHGLDYHNVESIAQLGRINTLNIGYSIIARSVFVGLKEATQEMQRLIREA